MTEDAIEKHVIVPMGVADAHHLFTDRIGDWWPGRRRRAGFRAGPDRLAFRGDRLIATEPDGTETVVADVLERDGPHRLVLDWLGEPGAPGLGRVTIRFDPVGDATRVSLRHDGFAPAAAAWSYVWAVATWRVSPWPAVLWRFARGCLPVRA